MTREQKEEQITKQGAGDLCEVIYYCAKKEATVPCKYDLSKGKLERSESGGYKYRVYQKILDNGTYSLLENKFQLKGYEFAGWELRIRACGETYYYLTDGSVLKKEEYQIETHGKKYLFSEGETLPVLAVKGMKAIIAAAVWKKKDAAKILQQKGTRIGIISINMYSKGLNFACPLHTFAFQQFLKKKGIDSTVINYKPNYYDNFDLRCPRDYYGKKLELLEKNLPADLNIYEEKKAFLTEKRDAYAALYEQRKIRYDKFQHFIDTNYKKTEYCYNSDLLEAKDPGFDCYICATDVIWKDAPGTGFDRGFFLGSSCMEGKGKIAYSASRGVPSESTQQQKDLFFYYLQDFDAISVREASLKRYIEENSDRQAVQVLDPVLLHEKEFYEKFTQKPKEENYLFLYYVMEKAEATIEQAVRYAKAHHLKIVEMTELPLPAGRIAKEEEVEHIYRYDVGIEEWLGYIQNAACVFTNSFHACCFSVLFEKDLFVGFRKGDKVKHIMKMLGIGHRIFRRDSDLLQMPPEPIDYEKVRKKLARKRKESEEFLMNALLKSVTEEREHADYESYKKALRYPVRYYSDMDNKGTFLPRQRMKINDGTAAFDPVPFEQEKKKLLGWNLRIRIDNEWFYYLSDGTLMEQKEYNGQNQKKKALLGPKETIPYLAVNRIAEMTAEAVWETKQLGFVRKFSLKLKKKAAGCFSGRKQ